MSGVEHPAGGLRADLERVRKERARLGALAYRLLGSVADAEDAVQEVYRRWYTMAPTEREVVVTPIAWHTRTLTRICFDHLRSARVRREVYVGEWLPEPVPCVKPWTTDATSTLADPAERITLDESISMALMVVLDQMTPAERVSFILHDVFQYSFREIAQIVGRSPQACRQLAWSARKHAQEAGRNKASSAEHHLVNEEFRAAWTSGNIQALVQILDPKARAIVDGGGQVSASIDPICGAYAIATFYASIFQRQPDLELLDAIVNAEPGIIGRAKGRTVAVVATAVRDGRISQIWAVRNPAKLIVWQ